MSDKREFVKKTINEASEHEAEMLEKGDRVRLATTTRDPDYEEGTVLQVVDPNYDRILGDVVILARGDKGTITLNKDMYEVL